VERKPQERSGRIDHYFTVDVEEYFHVSAFEGAVRREDWLTFESRVEAGVAILLDGLEAAGAHGTFFVLGWLAERHPALVRGIAERGHEVASHGWDHRRVTEQSPEEFRDSIRSSKRLLEDLTGRTVLGFRAPSFSIVRGREWALDVLAEEGYVYDSSLLPVRRPGYGYRGGVRGPHWLDRPTGRLAEIPPATVRWLGCTLPAGGGAYFRLFPYAYVRHALRAAERSGTPATFYIHPWELDPQQPRVAVGRLTRLRHYTGLGRTGPRLHRLLRDFRFTAIATRFTGPSSAPSA
jgi:polysaccharide deacetylase family protein (PEP-CTERM system associated)